MTMFCLSLSLFALQFFLIAPLAIGKEQVESKEVHPLSDVDESALGSDGAEIPSPSIFLMGNKGHEKLHLLQRFGANAPAVHHHVQVKRSSAGRENQDIPPQKAENEFDDCQREDMIVNTTELGFPTKHVIPGSFNAYQCKGKCSLKKWKKYIAHSLLKAYLEEKKGIKNDRNACCVPIKLRPMSLVYYAENGGFVIRTFEDVIVEECGCY